MILVGTGGHAKVVYEALLASGTAKSSVTHTAQSLSGVDEIFTGHEISSPEFPDGVVVDNFHIAIGDNTVRSELFSKGEKLGGKGASIVHPDSRISPSAEIDAASFVAAGAIVAAKANVGLGSILNHNSITDHDCIIGKFCHIAPGSILGGEVSVGDLTLIGSGAIVMPGLKIGKGVVVGAGSVVTKPIADGAVWIGTKLVGE